MDKIPGHDTAGERLHLQPPKCEWPSVVICSCILIICVVLKDSQACGQQVPPTSPALPVVRQASATQDVAADDTTADDLPDDPDDILALADESLESLSTRDVVVPALEVEVSTVSRTESTVGRSPAAVFVITNEMIRRSGARSIPEVLRMAPGVQVARIDANKWAITIRGFNGRFANKLLVQIDGRSVYTPLFGGVWWDVQDVVLEDVERIEVIRGPGATVWGANAVNGVINIISKKASDTQGMYVQGGAGTEELGFTTARYGGRIGNNAHYRLYGKWFERDEGFAAGDNAQDDSRMGRGGFRADWTPSTSDTVTLQGDYYDGKAGERSLYPSLTAPAFVTAVDQDESTRGGNVLFRWRRELSDDSDWALQIWYDRTERAFLRHGFAEDRDTFDLDFQHRFPLGYRHSIIWGFGYRNTKDAIRDSDLLIGTQPILSFTPHERADDLFSYFIQDEITLHEDLLYLTVGSKFEHNDYTGFEFQPTGRLLWTPSPRHAVWASISRAVRTPTRAEEDMWLLGLPVGVMPWGDPIFLNTIGSRAMAAEEVMAYEAGVRVQPTDRFFWDLAVFFNQYENLRSVGYAPFPVPGPGGSWVVPGTMGNSNRVQTYGFEIAGTYDVTDSWRLYAAYNFLVIPNSNTGSEMGDPRNQIYLQSSWDLHRDLHFDMVWRYVDLAPGVAIPGMPGMGIPGVPAYNAMDVRLAWDARPGMELAVVGRHLLDSSHLEAPMDVFLGTVNTEVEAEVYGTVTWRY